jgi:alkylhydroperoxidase family enzyme
MTPLPLPTPEDASDLDPAIVAQLEGMPHLNVLWMLGRTGWLDVITAALAKMFTEDQFPARDREVMILRIAAHTGVDYPIPQHRVFARNSGLTDPEVEAIVRRDFGALDAWTAELCAISEEITDDISLQEESLAALVAHYGRNGAAKAVWLMSWFNMLVRFVASTRIPIETDYDSSLRGPA